MQDSHLYRHEIHWVVFFFIYNSVYKSFRIMNQCIIIYRQKGREYQRDEREETDTCLWRWVTAQKFNNKFHPAVYIDVLY